MDVTFDPKQCCIRHTNKRALPRVPNLIERHHTAHNGGVKNKFRVCQKRNRPLLADGLKINLGLFRL